MQQRAQFYADCAGTQNGSCLTVYAKLFERPSYNTNIKIHIYLAYAATMQNHSWASKHSSDKNSTRKSTIWTAMVLYPEQWHHEWKRR